MPLFKIWPVGSTDCLIEEGRSFEEACRKAGKNLQDCEVQLIPEEQIIHLDAEPPRFQQ